MAHYKIPRYVHVVDEFPMTMTGKVRKVDMREESARLFGPKAPDRVEDT
jgi:fatty-acyl-CoA synthase